MADLPIRRPARLTRQAAQRAARELSDQQEHVVSRRQLSSVGVPRWLPQAELQVGRWQQTGPQTLVLHNGPLTPGSLPWIAVLEAGERAALDGVSSLLAGGLTGITTDEVHVIAPKSSTPVQVPGVRVHESRRFDESHVLTNGIRRTRPDIAAVHAALWARSDRQAALFLIVAVQQRLTTASALNDALATVRRHARRRMIARTILEIGGGVHSLGELDVAQDFRRRGLPEPDRQVVRQRPDGRQYLDVDLAAYGVRFEIDGAGHDAPEQRLDDLVRDITTAAEGHTVVRISLWAYSLDRERVLDAVEELLQSRGWVRGRRAA